MDAAREWVFAGNPNALRNVEVGYVLLVIDDLGLDAGVGEATWVVGTDDRRGAVFPDARPV